MAFTAGTTNIKLKHINSIAIDDGGVISVSIDGCDVESGVNLTIADGEMMTLACGATQEISEKATLNFVYLPDTAAEGAAVKAADGIPCRVILEFTTGEVLDMNNLPFPLMSVTKQIVAGQVAKYNISFEVSKANIDELLTYTKL